MKYSADLIEKFAEYFFALKYNAKMNGPAAITWCQYFIRRPAQKAANTWLFVKSILRVIAICLSRSTNVMNAPR